MSSPGRLTLQGLCRTGAPSPMRRLLNLFFVSVFCLYTVVQPQRAYAYAFAAPFAGAPMIATLGGPVGLAVVAGAVGLIGLWLLIPDGDGGGVRIPLSDKPQSQPPAPVAPNNATPLSGGVPITQYSYDGANYYDSKDAACSAVAPGRLTWCQAYSSSWVSGGAAITDGVCKTSCCLAEGGCNYFPETMYTRNTTSATTCPKGYVVSGTSCVLSDPREAVPDKNCDLKFGNSKFVYHNDPDCPQGTNLDNNKLQPGLRNDGRTAFVSGVDSSGRPVIIEVVVMPDGTQIEIHRYTQVSTGDTPAVQTQTTTVNPQTGQITGTQTSTNPGTITQPNTTPTTGTDSGTPTDTPTANTDPTKEATITCGLPGTPACSIDDTGFTSKDAVGDKVTTATAQLDALKTSIENTGSNLPSIGRDWFPSLLPGTAVACHPLPITIGLSKGPMAGMTHTENLDLCPHFDVVRQILGYLLGIWTLWHIWRRFTDSNKGE